MLFTKTDILVKESNIFLYTCTIDTCNTKLFTISNLKPIVWNSALSFNDNSGEISQLPLERIQDLLCVSRSVSPERRNATIDSHWIWLGYKLIRVHLRFKRSYHNFVLIYILSYLVCHKLRHRWNLIFISSKSYWQKLWKILTDKHIGYRFLNVQAYRQVYM